MAELRGALEDAISGRGRLVMLVGEPGIGKTRTAQELAEHARGLGAQVWWGRCYEEQGMPPYWPWVQAMRSYMRGQDSEQLRSLMGAGASDIAEILPDVKAKLPDLPPPPAVDSPEYARFRLFDSITAFLKSVAQAQPLVLVLDDLHWADKPSLMLLQFVATEMSNSHILVVGCYRDVELSRQHPLSETLAQLTREPVFQRTVLRGLSQNDTGKFLEVAVGVRPTPALVQTIYFHAEGNPFFMAEVVRLLQEQGEFLEAGIPGSQRVRIPEGVREVIGQRLNRLSGLCNQVLTEASVIGREFTLPQLNHIVEDVSETQLLDALDKALAARVIEELPQAAGRYQFTHALVQETLLQELTLTRRVRLHARVAQALEALYGAAVEAHAAELAHHYTQAETLVGTDKLVHYSLLAGEQALAAYAYEEALGHFQRGLTAKEGKPVNDETAALWFGLGRAQLGVFERYQMPEAINNLRHALDYYLEVRNVEQAVAIADVPLSAGEQLASSGTEFASRVLPLLPGGSLAAARLLCRHGFYLGTHQGNYEAAEEALKQALQTAQREGDKVLEMQVYRYGGAVSAYHAQWRSALDNCNRGIELAQRHEDPVTERGCHLYATRCLMVFGETEQATQRAQNALALYEKARSVFGLASALVDMVELSNLKGEWGSARAFSDRGLELSPADTRLIHHRSVMEFQIGAYDQGQIYLGRLLEAVRLLRPGPNRDYAGLAAALACICRITGEPSHLKTAKEAANAVVSSPNASPRWLHLARTGLGVIAVEEDDIELATTQYDCLKSMAGLMVQGGFICFDRLLGLLAQTTRNSVQAQVHFEDALAFCRKAGYRPELAWTCCDYADTLLQRNNAGDREKARSLLEESLSISTELGMRPLMERVQSRLDGLGPAAAPSASYPAGLTQREVEVLSLIAGGKSNQEIADQLFISLRTAANHVASILNKTNSANRAEAATYAARHSLV